MKQNESGSVILEIRNPKIKSNVSLPKKATVFPYYAGYASSFAREMLESMMLPPNALIADPWNGSGTTTLAAAALGLKAIGFDLNPVMVIAAKAALLSRDKKESLLSICNKILSQSLFPEIRNFDDPLETWLFPSSAKVVRAIETSINSLFSKTGKSFLDSKHNLQEMQSAEAFFYICLFRSVRDLLLDFVPTNPTWVKQPVSKRHRKRPARKLIEEGFTKQVCRLSQLLPTEDLLPGNLKSIKILLGDAKNLPLENNTVDAVVTSPPYCTRIDYAVATSIELAVLGYGKEDFSNIRRSLMGSSTVEKKPQMASTKWGPTCLKFLNEVYNHSSQASKTYYYKTHTQYFYSLKESIDEIARILKVNGKAILVVQDSYYKEIRTDIAQITIEMAGEVGLNLTRRKDFVKNNSISVINSRARKHLLERQTTETVLIFSREY